MTHTLQVPEADTPVYLVSSLGNCDTGTRSAKRRDSVSTEVVFCNYNLLEYEQYTNRVPDWVVVSSPPIIHFTNNRTL